jgi:hypothetical protein
MEVFVVMGSVSYEGSVLLGVYHTLEDAREAIAVYRSEIGDDWDTYAIQRRVLGARADWDGDRYEVELI